MNLLATQLEAKRAELRDIPNWFTLLDRVEVHLLGGLTPRGLSAQPSCCLGVQDVLRQFSWCLMGIPTARDIHDRRALSEV